MAFKAIFLSLIVAQVLSQRNATVADYLEKYKCDVRYELSAALEAEKECSQWVSLRPVCNRSIEVSFSDAPPYVYRKGNEIKGVLPGVYYKVLR